MKFAYKMKKRSQHLATIDIDVSGEWERNVKERRIQSYTVLLQILRVTHTHTNVLVWNVYWHADASYIHIHSLISVILKLLENEKTDSQNK